MKIKLGRGEDFFPISLSEKERALGTFIVGATGKGKSTLLENMLQQDLRLPQCAIVLVDPSGFLARKVYAMAGKREVHYLSLENPISLNPIFTPYSSEQTIDTFIEIINHIFEATKSNDPLTGRMKKFLIRAVRWCLDHNRPRLDAVRDRLKNDPETAYGKHYSAVDGVVDRIDLILDDPKINQILCQEEIFNWQEFTEKKGIFIFDSYGMSQEKNVFVGSVLTHLIRAYFRMTRLKEYKPLALYIDECQHYINYTFYDVLKEGRKYNILTTLATQDFANVPPKFTHTVLSNIGTIVSLSPGAREAREISSEYRDMDASGVKFTDKHHGAIRTPSFEGIVKMYPPPLIKDRETPTQKAKPVDKIWFDLTK